MLLTTGEELIHEQSCSILIKKTFSVVAPKSGMNHPFHLHRQIFYVMDMGQYVDGQTAQELLNWLNSNVKRMSPAPALKDTIAVPSGGYAVIKFKANKAGKLSLSIHWNGVC
jgi:FtsP/CotA-like multicopper oxidase with cupredoxin domain